MKERRLDVLSGSEGCLPLRIHLSTIQFLQCSKDIYEAPLPVMAHLQFMGLKMVAYLDDILLMARPGDSAEANPTVYHSPGTAGFYNEQAEVNPAIR